jgi:hypothetical protein
MQTTHFNGVVKAISGSVATIVYPPPQGGVSQINMKNMPVGTRVGDTVNVTLEITVKSVELVAKSNSR